MVFQGVVVDLGRVHGHRHHRHNSEQGRTTLWLWMLRAIPRCLSGTPPALGMDFAETR